MLYANWIAPTPNLAPAVARKNQASPTYTGRRLAKDQTPAELLAEMRRLHPGKPLFCHRSFLDAIGETDDLTESFWAQPGELWIVKEEH